MQLQWTQVRACCQAAACTPTGLSTSHPPVSQVAQDKNGTVARLPRGRKLTIGNLVLHTAGRLTNRGRCHQFAFGCWSASSADVTHDMTTNWDMQQIASLQCSATPAHACMRQTKLSAPVSAHITFAHPRNTIIRPQTNCNDHTISSSAGGHVSACLTACLQKRHRRP